MAQSRRLVMTLSAAVVAVTLSSGLSIHAQTDVKPINDLPNPYTRTNAWGQLPAGMKWAAVIGAEPGPDGNVYVVHRCFANSCAGRTEPPIFKFNPSGKLLKSWGVGTFVFPHGLYVDRDGSVWVTDAQGQDGKGHQVFKYSPDGNLLMTLGKAGVAGDPPEALNQPTDVVTAPNGDIFVTEGHGGPTNRISKFSKTGTFIKSWGKKGPGPGEFNAPHTIAIDSRGRLFVGDRSNNRIQLFDQDGTFIAEWKQFARPSGIYITKDDTMYVADSESWGPDQPGWKKGIRIGSAKDGSVKYFIEDIESTTTDHSGAEGVGVDAEGNVYGAVVRRQMLERHVLKKGSSHPDFQGVWTYATMTPLERPRELASKDVLTDEEAAQFERQTLQRRSETNQTAGQDWWDLGTKLLTNRRTSLIVDPPTGRIPPATAEAQKRAAERAEARRARGAYAGPEDLGLNERCVTWTTAGPPMLPGPYNNNVEFLEVPDYMIIFNEMIHDARIVPMDGRPHGTIRRWMGDSRGRWQGNTLIVDTINFTDKTNFRGADENLHLVERFTRVADDTIQYEFTADDPTAWTASWTAAFPLTKTDGLILEYACHEGNYRSMVGVLEGARFQEKSR